MKDRYWVDTEVPKDCSEEMKQEEWKRLRRWLVLDLVEKGLCDGRVRTLRFQEKCHLHSPGFPAPPDGEIYQIEVEIEEHPDGTTVQGISLFDTVGLVEGLAAVCRILADCDLSPPEVQEALKRMVDDESVESVLEAAGMQIVEIDPYGFAFPPEDI